jgi:hypothetical protein
MRLCDRPWNPELPLLHPLGLMTQLSYLMGLVDGSPGPLTQAERERFADLEVQWTRLRAQTETLVTTELQRVNTPAANNGLNPGIVRKSKTQ